jgi:hypothetical protein
VHGLGIRSAKRQIQGTALDESDIGPIALQMAN